MTRRIQGLAGLLALLPILLLVTTRPAAAQDAPAFATAVLHPTEGNDARGTVRFRQVMGGLWVEAELSGLEAGVHAYHVHLLGDCTAPDGTSAGTHFDFHGSSEHPPADIDRITGDLGEIEADASGRATHSALVEGASLYGPKSILGRAVIVHARGNDPTQPPIGAAGPRVACGVIGIAAGG